MAQLILLSEKNMQLFDMPGHLIRRLNQLSTNVFQQAMKASGHRLTSVQFAAMVTLQQQPDIEQAQLAALIAYDRATIGGVIDRLEQKGYVTRQVSDQDRRARLCRLTRTGEQLLAEISPTVIELQNEILAGLNPDEVDQFTSLAQKVLMSNQQ